MKRCLPLAVSILANLGGGERLSRGYAYNSFTYDGLGRLTSAYDRTYAYDGASGPFHAVGRIGNADRFDSEAVWTPTRHAAHVRSLFGR